MSKTYRDQTGVTFIYNEDLSGVEIDATSGDGTGKCAVTGPAILRFVEHAFETGGAMTPPPPGAKRPLPETCDALTHKFTVHGHGFDGEPKRYKCYLTVNLYEDGSPGGIQVSMDKVGGRQGALLDCWCHAVSSLLQRGCPVEDVIQEYRAVGFEPQGFVDGHEAIKTCRSPVDYIARWLEIKFGAES